MKKLIFSALLGLVAITTNDLQAQTQQVRVTVTSNAPTGGIALTPLWAGFHDGSFDSYNGGLTAQTGIERIAEDGNASVLSADFLDGYTYVDNGTSSRLLTGQTSGRVDGVIGSVTGPPPISPGESATMLFDLDASQNNYFSYASMVLPSNDFIVFNGNPTAHSVDSLFNGGGPISFDIGLAGTIDDVGTEVNDFATSAANSLFGLPGGQTGPNQGADELGVITNVTASNPFEGFLNTPDQDLSLFNFNDTNLYGNGVATVTIEAVQAVPEPSTAALLSLGLVGMFARRRRQC
jgi:hypothetical protein